MATLAIAKLRRDGGTQFRTDLHRDAVADYAAALARGEKLPPIVVFYDGTNYWLADGYHTTKAHEEIKAKEIDADIRAGTQRDARLYAATKANRGHGLRFTNDEKRARVKALLDDAEWSAWTNPVIAAECGVSYEMVRGLRPESTNFADSEAPKTRKGKDGKNYPVDRAKKAKPEVEKPPTAPKAQVKVTYDRGAGGDGDDCQSAPDDGLPTTVIEEPGAEPEKPKPEPLPQPFTPALFGGKPDDDEADAWDLAKESDKARALVAGIFLSWPKEERQRLFDLLEQVIGEYR